MLVNTTASVLYYLFTTALFVFVGGLIKIKRIYLQHLVSSINVIGIGRDGKWEK